MNYKTFIDNIIRLMKADTTNLSSVVSYISPFTTTPATGFPIISIEIVNPKIKPYSIGTTTRWYDFDIRIICIEKVSSLSAATGSIFNGILAFVDANPQLKNSNNVTTCFQFGATVGRDITFNLAANEYGDQLGGVAFYIDIPCIVKS